MVDLIYIFLNYFQAFVELIVPLGEANQFIEFEAEGGGC